MLKVKRIYEPPADNDGFRVLIDRLWPRGISKEKGKIDVWLKEIAPSDALRKWYKHDPKRWDEFRDRYFRELDENTEHLDAIISRMNDETVTLLFSSRETQLNNAHALKEYLESRF